MQAMMYKQTQTNKQILYLSRVKYKMALNKNKTHTKKTKNHTDPTNYYTSNNNKNKKVLLILKCSSEGSSLIK